MDTRFHRTLQKGFRRTGNPDLVNDIIGHDMLEQYFDRYYFHGLLKDTCCTVLEDWSLVSVYMIRYSENLIRKFQDKVDWSEISRYQTLSEPFIREFQDRVDWNQISRYQKLSEAFIHRYRYKVNWNRISEYQVLSEPFILKHGSMVNWEIILRYQIISQALFDRHKKKNRMVKHGIP